MHDKTYDRIVIADFNTKDLNLKKVSKNYMAF